MTAMRAEAINLLEQIPEENLSKVLTALKKFVVREDPFWSEANQKHLRESIRELDEGKVVTFTDEEWEKFTNAQDIH